MSRRCSSSAPIRPAAPSPTCLIRKVYARFFWQQFSPERYRLLLTNPLGSTEMDLNVQKNVVQLTDNQGKRYVSDNPEEMIRKLTGMAIR